MISCLEMTPWFRSNDVNSHLPAKLVSNDSNLQRIDATWHELTSNRPIIVIPNMSTWLLESPLGERKHISPTILTCLIQKTPVFYSGWMKTYCNSGVKIWVTLWERKVGSVFSIGRSILHFLDIATAPSSNFQGFSNFQSAPYWLIVEPHALRSDIHGAGQQG